MNLPKLVNVTTKQATWKTVRGMVAKNLIALMLTGHPLGLIENVIHAPIDWIVNKNFCTDNKLLNMGVHVATCMSVDSLIHGTGHEIAETLMTDGGGQMDGLVHSDMVTNSDVLLSSTTDVSDVVVDGSTDVDTVIDQIEISESFNDTTISEVQQPVMESSVAQSSSVDSPMKKLLEQKAKSMSKMMEMMGDGDISPSELVQIHQAADAQGLIDHTGHHHTAGDSHAGHHHGDTHTHGEHGEHADHTDHTDHNHEHGGHGLGPILGGAIIEEYGPMMYKITKQRTQYFWDTMFNLTPIQDTKIIKKSDLNRV